MFSTADAWRTPLSFSVRASTLPSPTSKATGSLPATSYLAMVAASSAGTSCMPTHCAESRVRRRETARSPPRASFALAVNHSSVIGVFSAASSALSTFHGTT